MAENIEEIMLKAEAAPEPGDLKLSSKVEGESGIPEMSVTELKSAGWVYIYDTKTRERSITNRNMLKTQLTKKRQDGTPVFTTNKPTEPPFRGTLKCWLHLDDPNRSHYDDIGLPICKKSNLTSPYQVRRHMEKRHRTEFQIIEQENKETKELSETAKLTSLLKAIKSK
jgi:hypothetical protein